MYIIITGKIFKNGNLSGSKATNAIDETQSQKKYSRHFNKRHRRDLTTSVNKNQTRWKRESENISRWKLVGNHVSFNRNFFFRKHTKTEYRELAALVKESGPTKENMIPNLSSLPSPRSQHYNTAKLEGGQTIDNTTVHEFCGKLFPRAGRSPQSH